MKKIIGLIIFLSFSTITFSQFLSHYISQSELGVHMGTPIIIGEIAPQLGWGGGFLHIRNNNTEKLAIKKQFSYFKTNGLDYFPSDIRTSPGTVRFIYELAGKPDSSLHVRNHQTTIHNLSIEFLWNIHFNKFKIQPGLGIYYSQYKTLLDILNDSGNPYDYSRLTNSINQRGGFSRSDYGIINNIHNQEYEFVALSGSNVINLVNRNIIFTDVRNSYGLSFTVNLAYDLTENVDIGFSSVFVLLSDDLDGHFGNSKQYDKVLYNSIYISHHL